MNSSKLQEELFSAIAVRKYIEEQTRELKKNIEKYGRELVEELTKLPGWNCMMQLCRDHYREYDNNRFFDICSYELGEYEYENHLLVKKYYSGADPDGYIVFDIDLRLPLETQISNRKRLLQSKYAAKEESERREYERLKKKFELDGE